MAESKRVLLTGGTGFIGSRVAAALAARGHEPVLLVRASSTGERLGALWERCRRVQGDIDDPASLAAAVREADPQLVIHLAKRLDCGYEDEVRSSAALAAALAKAPRLARWVRTAHPPRGRASGTDRELARSLAARHALKIVTLELYQVYGPGTHRDDPTRRLAEAALAGKPLRAPDESKDLVFVDDCAEAYALASEAPGVDGEWLPIGGGRLVTGLELARAVAKAAGRGPGEVEPASAPRTGGEPAPLGPAKAKLGWAPRTTLERGAAALVGWCRAGAAGAA